LKAITDKEEKLQHVLGKLVDVDTIMNTMPSAIKNAAKLAM
jgi:hypothetical protein